MSYNQISLDYWGLINQRSILHWNIQDEIYWYSFLLTNSHYFCNINILPKIKNLLKLLKFLDKMFTLLFSFLVSPNIKTANLASHFGQPPLPQTGFLLVEVLYISSTDHGDRVHLLKKFSWWKLEIENSQLEPDQGFPKTQLLNLSLRIHSEHFWGGRWALYFWLLNQFVFLYKS